MKLVIGIVRPHKANDVLEALYRCEVSGLTISRVEGHGGELDHVQTYRGTTVKMELSDKVRFDIAVSDEFVEPTTRQNQLEVEHEAGPVEVLEQGNRVLPGSPEQVAETGRRHFALLREMLHEGVFHPVDPVRQKVKLGGDTDDSAVALEKPNDLHQFRMRQPDGLFDVLDLGRRERRCARRRSMCWSITRRRAP